MGRFWTVQLPQSMWMSLRNRLASGSSGPLTPFGEAVMIMRLCVFGPRGVSRKHIKLSAWSSTEPQRNRPVSITRFLHSPLKMSYWSQYNEDSCRLPEGFRRIGYDADTKRYTFSDKRGKLYQSAPGEEYGTLAPIVSTSTSRPEAFYSDKQKPKVSVSTTPAAKTFHDFLPSSAITSPSSSSGRNSLSPPPSARFVDAARRAALPKMQGVVQSLRRSTTSAHKSGHSYDEERRGLLRIPSTSTTASSVSASTVGRSKSSATQRSQYQYTKTHSRKSSV